MAVTRDDLIRNINEIALENPQWAEQIQQLVTGFENDEISIGELSELIMDYNRQLENDAAIAEVELRVKIESTMEMLWSLARAVV
jgi:hypothetical protein